MKDRLLFEFPLEDGYNIKIRIITIKGFTMDDEMSEELKDKFTKVCLCRAISRATIKSAIKEGAVTLQQIQKKTRAGSGSCKGRRCTPKIIELLEQTSES